MKIHGCVWVLLMAPVAVIFVIYWLTGFYHNIEKAFDLL